MKRTIILFTALLIASSCHREADSHHVTRSVIVSVKIDSYDGGAEDTKSQIDEADTRLRSCTLYAFDSGGSCVADKHITSTGEVNWELPGAATRVLALANCPGSYPSASSNYSTLKGMVYETSLSAFLTGIPSTGMPMSGEATVSGGSFELRLKRLYARYDINFDFSAFEGFTVETTSITGVNSPARAFWFADMGKPSAFDSSMVSLDSANSSELADVGGGVTLYFLENLQGNKGSASHWYDVQFAAGSTYDKCSNIYIKTAYTGESTTRTATTRVYLGSDCTTNFDVRRNVRRTLNLALDPGESKEIYFGPGTVMEGSAASTFEITYETTLGSKSGMSLVTPAGFTVLSHDHYAENEYGLHPECAYSGKVTYSRPSSAIGNQTFTFTIQAADSASGDISDEAIVHFPYSFSFSWDDSTTPLYVAQRNRLTVTDGYTGAKATDSFTFSSGKGCSVLIGQIDGASAYIGLAGVFARASNAVTANGPGGVALNVPLECRMPFFRTSVFQPMEYIDDEEIVDVIYQGATWNGSRWINSQIDLSVVDAEEAVDCDLCLDLVNEYLPVTFTTTGGILAMDSERYLTDDGKLRCWIYLSTFNGLNPSGTTFTADRGTIGIEGCAAVEAKDYVVYNPWKNFAGYSIKQGGVMNDYTLYREPVDPAGGSGWKDRNAHQHAPSEPYSAVYSVNGIPGIAAGSEENLALRFRFAEGEQGELGDIFSGSASNGNGSWSVSYSMYGKTSDDITEHGAGLILAEVRFVNPHDGSYIERVIAEAYMRLHLFVFASVTGPYKHESLYDNALEIYPYSPTDGKHIIALENLGFYSRSIIERQDAITTGKGSITRFGGSAYEGGIMFDNQRAVHGAPGASAYVLSESNLNYKSKNDLRLSFAGASIAYKFKSLGELDGILGTRSLYYDRTDDFTLCYDPTGDEGRYSRQDSNYPDSEKLFVLHVIPTFFFDPANGF